jgi:hypothetical protein
VRTIPATDVRGPDRGDDAGEQCLYPSEFLQFVECEQVPLRWRRIVALATYFYPRDAEIRALQCRDVDTEHLSMKITKAIDRRTGQVKATKGRRHRNVPIEVNAVPLLDTPKAELNDTRPLVPDSRASGHGARAPAMADEGGRRPPRAPSPNADDAAAPLPRLASERRNVDGC